MGSCFKAYHIIKNGGVTAKVCMAFNRSVSLVFFEYITGDRSSRINSKSYRTKLYVQIKSNVKWPRIT